MKKIIVILFLFSVSSIFGQYDKKKDSLKTVINTTKNDSLIADAYIELSLIYKEEYKLDSSLFFSNKAYKIADKRGLVVLKGWSLVYDGNVYLRKRNHNKALKKYQEALEIFKEAGNDSGILSVYGNFGTIYQLQNDLEKAISYYIKTIELCKKLKAPRREISALFNISILYYRLRSPQKSLEYCLKINQVKEENNLNDYFSIRVNNMLGNIYTSIKDHDKAVLYIEKALTAAIRTKNSSEEALALLNLSRMYLEEYDDVLKAENYLNRALKILESVDFQIGLYSGALIRMAKVKNKKLKFNEGIELAIKALEFSKQQKSTSDERDAYSILAELYVGKKQFKKALENHKNFKTLSDSIAKVESLSVVANLETKYQTQQKENEILQLTNENIQKEASLTQSRYTIFGILGVLILVLSLVYFYWTKRKQQHKLALLENSVVAIEQEKSRIGKELHDNIAGSLMKLVHDSETVQVQLSHQLLQAYNEIRNLSHQLDNTPMHGEPFLDRVMDIIPENSKTQEFTFNITPPYLQIDEPYGTHVFRMIQELITNNLKYANASDTQINIVLEKGILTLVYKDNGKGTSNFKKGNGYRNMENRVVLMDGTLEIEHQQGFSVVANIPYST